MWARKGSWVARLYHDDNCARVVTCLKHSRLELALPTQPRCTHCANPSCVLESPATSTKTFWGEERFRYIYRVLTTHSLAYKMEDSPCHTSERRRLLYCPQPRLWLCFLTILICIAHSLMFEVTGAVTSSAVLTAIKFCSLANCISWAETCCNTPLRIQWNDLVGSLM